MYYLISNRAVIFFTVDSSNSGGENMYTLMKPVPSTNMGSVSNRKKL